MASTKPEFWTNYNFGPLITFSEDDSGLIFSSGWPEPKPVTYINSEDANLNQPDTEYAVLLKYDQEHIYAKEAIVRQICSSWNLPATSAHNLFFFIAPERACSEPIGTTTCIWYRLTVPIVMSSVIGIKLKIHVCHVLDNETRTARTLILCPREIEENVSKELSKQVTKNGRARETMVWPSWFTAHLVLAREVEDLSSVQHHVQVDKMAKIAYNQANGSIDGALDAECLKNCNAALELIGEFDLVMESNKRVLNQMRHYPDDSFLGSQTVLSGMQNAIHGIDVLVSSSARLKNNLLSVRHTLLHTMEIRNANYMRANTIALRRIAAQAQVESKHAKAQSESSAKNAVTATRIAILTMIYLPPTFVATVFSTPFLQLDDELQFSAAKKIWVYIVASLACILITLLSFLPWLTDRNSKPKETSPVEDDTGLQNPDEALLEPMAVALPDVKDLEREVKKRMFPGRFALDAEDAEVDAFEWPDKHFLPPEEDSTE